jgi:predicted nucleic acid-binding protein
MDTNALSDFLEGRLEVGRIVQSRRAVVVPVIVLGEYRYGLMSSYKRPVFEEALNRFLLGVTVLAITDATTQYYAESRHALRRLGTPIPSNDLWIAALALQHGLAILSRDAHFDAVAGVRRVGWYGRAT